MILSNINTINPEYINPEISICDRVNYKKYEFPDPNTYFIISEVGKNYSIQENATIVLNFFKGYFAPRFNLNFSSNLIINLSKNIFSETKHINGDAKTALDLAIVKAAKNTTTLKNRF